MNPLLRSTLEIAQKTVRRLKEKAGLVSGFSDIEMHLWMLADETRGAAFERAIGSAIRGGEVVADVGAGTGLLSMMACRAGASRVYAVEEAPVIELAKALVRENGYEDRVVFLRGNSRKIDLPERADLVVSETIGTFVFSEDILPTLVDARERFLKSRGVMIPERIKVYLVPVESFREGIGFWEKPLRGFDFRAGARHVPAGTVVAARKTGRGEFLDDEQVAYDLEFATASATMEFSRTLEFTSRREGTLHGFFGFWEARLHGEVSLTCGPGAPPVHWPPVLFRLPEGIPVRTGDRISLHFTRKDRPGWSWVWKADVRRGAPSA